MVELMVHKKVHLLETCMADLLEWKMEIEEV